MRYTVTKQRIQVIGTIWMPAATCAQEQDLRQYDLDNIGDLTDRDSVEAWVAMHFGDFQKIIDFRADFHVGDQHIVHEWAHEDSEYTFNDSMYGSED